MNLSDVKSRLGVPQLNLNPAVDTDGNDTGWLRHWENDTRTAISIHRDLVSQLQANPNLDTLEIQSGTKVGAKGEYTTERIVAYAPAEVVL